MFGLLHNHRITYRSREEVGGGVTAFAFTPHGTGFAAEPGQHGIVAVTTTARKPFSLASAPEETDILLGTSLQSGSPFKKRLAGLREGDEISLRGPIYTYGQRFMIDDPRTPSVLLAQGVGITPIRSILAHFALTGVSLDTTLIHVAAGGHPFREDTERWTTRSTYVDHATAFRTTIASAVDEDRERDFYIAGAPSFVSSTTRLLKEQGIDADRIREDKYLFYRPSKNLTDPEGASS